jgi:heptaprenylglyceryl phosphate synthase
LTLLVGGGIRIAAQAGADWIVTGTLTEDAADLAELRTRLSEVIDALQ